MPVTLARRGAALIPVVAANTEFVDNGDYWPMWLDADGVQSYWGHGKDLHTSTDDGHTFSPNRHTFPENVHGVRPMGDGELLVLVFRAQGFYAGIWRSTGWTANPATATWTEVITPSGQAPNTAGLAATLPGLCGTTGDRSNYFTSWFSSHLYPDGTFVTGEYGKQGNGTSIPGARLLVVSSDRGKLGTWGVAKDLFDGAQWGRPGEHMHGSALDPYTGRLWFTAGDHGCHTEYSDDWRVCFTGGTPTWHVHAGSVSEFGGIGNVGAGMPGTTQSIQPFAFPDRIVFTTDGPIDGITKIEKSRPDYLDIAHDLGLPHTGNLKYTGAMIFQRAAGYPVLFPQYVGAGTSGTWPSVIVASDPAGERFYDVFTDTVTGPNPLGIYNAIGPTARGKLLASIALDGRSAGQVSNTNGRTLMRADFPVIV